MKLFWKSYFAIFALLSLGGWVGIATHRERQGLSNLLQVFPDALLLVGLFGYAFGLRVGTPLIWRVLAGATALSIAAGAGWLIYLTVAGEAHISPPAAALAVTLVIVLVLPSVIALLRYAAELAAPARPPSDTEAGRSKQEVAPRSKFGQRHALRF